jgi:hypothetical protein
LASRFADPPPRPEPPSPPSGEMPPRRASTDDPASAALSPEYRLDAPVSASSPEHLGGEPH